MTRLAVSARDARLCSVPWIGSAGLSALRRALVVIVGLGNIGGQVAYHLALMGMRLLLIDCGLVEEVNLGTQGFAGGIGESKAECRARWLRALNPLCRIESMQADIRRLGMGALREASILASCLDNPAGRIALATAAMKLGIPFVDAALDGSGRSLFARVAAYAPGGACYLCPHDSASLARLLRAGLSGEGCSRSWTGRGEVDAPPTLAISALGGAAASMQAIWALRVLLGEAMKCSTAKCISIWIATRWKFTDWCATPAA